MIGGDSIAGRKKEPVALVQAKGKKHLTKAEIKEREEREVRAPSDEIAPPDTLTAIQKKEFEKIAKQLVGLEIMTNLDVDALAWFIISKDMYEKVTKQVRAPSVLKDIDQLEKLSRIQDRYYKACRATASDLGLTISSRCKLVMPKSNQKEEKVNKFLKFEVKTGNG